MKKCGKGLKPKQVKDDKKCAAAPSTKPVDTTKK